MPDKPPTSPPGAPPIDLLGPESAAATLRELIEAAPDAIVTVDSAGRIVLVNAQTERMFGWSRAELLGQPMEVLLPERYQGRHPQHRADYGQAPRPRSMGAGLELYGRRKDGGEFPVDISLSPIQTVQGTLVSSAIRDVTERKLAEHSLRRLNRTHAVLSRITSLIVRVQNRQELFEGACRIAVQEGHFRMAWIGLSVGDDLRPVAMHGHNEGYVEQANISTRAESPLGQGPTGRAFREKRPILVNDIANDPVMAPWRERALECGYRSSLSHPLMVGNQVAGIFNLYSEEVNFFDEGEVRLLAQLAGDIAYAMEFITRQEKLDFLTYYDPLTRLANRTLIAERLSQFIEMARQNHDRLAVLFLDLEHFRSVNVTQGMAAGDELLQQVVTRLTEFAGNASHLARMGSNAFAVIVPGLHEAADLSEILRERMWNRLDRPYPVAGQDLRISARIGISVFPDDGEDADSLLHNAEAALKNAKVAGERFLFYTRQMSIALKEKLRLESGLKRALEHKEFRIFYQPKVDLRTGVICGAEALLRWNSPEHGLVTPIRFISLLEESGMIVDVGSWVLEQATLDHDQWQAGGLNPPRIAVNVSALQLRDPDFVERVSRAVQKTDGTTPRIDLEMTESVLISRVEQSIQKLQQLRDMGFIIAIDDFGTGYSSLSYLTRLPISVIKIDRSFIVNMTASPETMSMVSAIISLAQSLKLRVVAEGVDSQEQLKLLRLLRCDEIQGYIFSKPLPADDFARLLREGRHLPPVQDMPINPAGI